VLDNLVKNALECLEQGPGEIHLAVAIPALERIVFTVEDSGPGIPENQDVFRLFETTKAYGTGLGLAIARHKLRKSSAATLALRCTPLRDVGHNR
jgi:signal transduction histidine kinase